MSAAATIASVRAAKIIHFPRRTEQVRSACSDCGTTIIDRTTRVFCDPCIEMNDG